MDTLAPDVVPSPLDRAMQLFQVLGQGITLGSLRGFQEDQLEAVYALGHAFHRQDRQFQAQRCFTFYVMHQHMDPRGHLALGVVQQAQGRHHAAAHAFLAASLLDPDDARAPLHLAECLAVQGQAAAARETLATALSNLRRRPDARVAARAGRLAATIGHEAATQPQREE